jgi:hypothetical protein
VGLLGFPRNACRPDQLQNLKSRVVESSLNCETWKEIDGQTDNYNLEGEPYSASFTVWKSAECSFVRLAQISKTHKGNDWFAIRAVDAFGTLIE